MFHVMILVSSLFSHGPPFIVQEFTAFNMNTNCFQLHQGKSFKQTPEVFCGPAKCI